MLRIFLLLAILFFPSSFSIETLKDVGIAKYAVLEATKNNAPIRDNQNENAKRLTHIFEKSILFADKQTDDYYRVELKPNEYGWINKKFVEVQAIIPEKRLENIEKITFKEFKDKYQIKFQIPTLSAYSFNENPKSLNFSLYDNRFDPTEILISSKNENFSIPDKIQNNFEFDYAFNKPLFGYGIETFEKGYVVSIKKAPKINPKRPLKNIKIVVDPGHGGDEFGAVAFNLKEKDINLQISKKLKKELSSNGAKVYLTRKKDKKVGLYDRIAFANEKNADILISIHQNSLANRIDIDKKHGVGTYYYNKQAYNLAKNIKDNLVIATNFRDDGTNYASFALTRPTMPVSVLVECGYIIKKDEAEKLSDKKFQKVIAKAITKGIKDYLIESFAN